MMRRQTTRRRRRREDCRETLAGQRLEDRRLLAFDLTAGETMLLYLVNQTRSAPQAAADRLSVWLPSNQVGPFQPIVPNEALRNAAQAHSTDMLVNHMGGHTGSDGSSPGQRALRFGYETDWVNENAAGGYGVNQPPAGNEALARSTNNGWFSSSLHRANMLTADWTEFGGAFSESFTQSSGQSDWSWRATELFGKYDAGPFLVGVVFNDQNGDSAYNVGEGLGGVAVTVKGPNGTFTTTTMGAGAWFLRVPAGEYLVSASGGQFVGASSVPVQVSNRNRSIDFISGQPRAWVNFQQHTNTAPVLASSGGNDLPAVLASNGNPSGTTVASLLGTSFSDADPIGLRGIAITNVPATALGTWQCSLDQGTTWLNLGSPTESSARLVAAEDLIRFVPNGSATGATVFSYRAWDRTSGQSGGTASVTSRGGQSPFSLTGAMARATVVGANTAPTLLASGGNGFRTVYEDALSYNGTTVAQLVGTGYQDPDSTSVPGIAVTELTGTADGTWFYSTDDGWSWRDIGSVSAAQALLLSPSDQLAFRPKKDQLAGFSASFRLWDQSSGRAGTRVDVSTPQAVGGATAFSAGKRTVSAVVVNTNDAPTLAPDASSLRLRPVAMNSSYYGEFTSIADLLGNACVDIDPGAEMGIAVIGIAQNGTLLGTFSSGNWGGTVSPSEARLYRATDRIGFMPNGGYAGESFVTFRLWDQTQGTTSRQNADLSQPDSSTGGSTAFGREVLTARVFVGPAGDAPSTSFQPVSMRPDQSAAQSVGLTFTEAVTGFDIGDLRLTRNGSPVATSGAMVSGTGRFYTISGLEQATSLSGTYVLRLPVAGTGISDSVGNRLTTVAEATFTVVGANLPPVAVALSSESIAENAGANAVVGTLTTTDPDAGNTFTYTLVTGTGSTDNAAFNISGNQLRATASFDFETKSSYSIRVRSTDQGGLSTEKILTIAVSDVPDMASTVSTTGSLSTVTTTYGGVSAASSVTVAGSWLTAPIIATVPAGFEVSRDNVSFGPSATFALAGGAVNGTAYVRLAAKTGAGTYSGSLLFSSVGAAATAVAIPTSQVQPKPLTITGLTAQPKVYDGKTNAQITGTAALFGKIGSDDVALTGTAAGAFVTKNAGPAKPVAVSGLTLTGTTARNYALAHLSLSATIMPAPLDVLADNKTRLVNTANPVLTATIKGVVRGESAATVLTGAATLVTKAKTRSPVGGYPISVAKGTLATKDGNYVIRSFVPGSLTVANRPHRPRSLRW